LAGIAKRSPNRHIEAAEDLSFFYLLLLFLSLLLLSAAPITSLRRSVAAIIRTSIRLFTIDFHEGCIVFVHFHFAGKRVHGRSRKIPCFGGLGEAGPHTSTIDRGLPPREAAAEKRSIIFVCRNAGRHATPMLNGGTHEFMCVLIVVAHTVTESNSYPGLPPLLSTIE